MDPADPRPPWRVGLPSTEDVPPPRPQRFDPGELRFTPRPAVRWFSPGVLTASALHVGVSSVFGSFLDKRELQATRPCVPDLRYASHDELWIDYVADTGDGFEATATVATTVGRRELRPEGLDRSLPRGDILVFGGDEVYPAASTEDYESRLEGPWRAALPWTAPPHPALYAIPGNHDWFDGLTGFLRLFGQGRWIGGWRTHQTRSYWAVQLPHHWWLWGVDIQADGLVDEPQLEYFARVAQRAEPGDRLILATAVPTWTRLDRDPAAYRNLAYLERTILRPAGIVPKLTVAGDLHHYSRYGHRGAEEEIGPTQKITSGGGGAFLHPTHVLPARATIGVDPDDPDDVTGYEMEAAYPDRARSRRLSAGALGVGVRNPSFCAVPAVVALALLWSVQFGLRSLGRPGETWAEAAGRWGYRDLASGLGRSSLAAVMVVALFGGLWAFAQTPDWAAQGTVRWVVKTVMALVHLVLQAAVMVAVMLAALTVASGFEGWPFAVVASVVAFALGGPAGATAVGLYLAVAIATPGVHAHANEAFAAARITRYKGFLRLHVDRDGALTVYALGIPRAVKRRRWAAVPDAGDPEAAWIAPEPGPPRVELIDTVTLR
jgi:hypothetical protein